MTDKHDMDVLLHGHSTIVAIETHEEKRALNRIRDFNTARNISYVS